MLVKFFYLVHFLLDLEKSLKQVLSNPTSTASPYIGDLIIMNTVIPSIDLTVKRGIDRISKLRQ